MRECGRRVSFLAAKKSMDRKWIGAMARSMNASKFSPHFLNTGTNQQAFSVAGGVWVDDQSSLASLRPLNRRMTVINKTKKTKKKPEYKCTMV